MYVPCIILQCVEEPTRCTNSYNVPTAWYSLLGTAPDDGGVVLPKHVEQTKALEK